MADPSSHKEDWLSRMLSVAMQGPLPLMFLLLAFAGGVIALLVTPREEEPQIIVPMADVLVAAPGLSAEQVERQIATPLEKILYQIDGVEYVYSMSRAEIDRLEAALSAAEANLSRLKRQKDEAGTALSYSKLTAPISGRIVGRYGDPGDTARRERPS